MSRSRRDFLLGWAAVLALAGVAVWPRAARADERAFPIRATDAEWRARLSPEAYAVLREAATEPPSSFP